MAGCWHWGALSPRAGLFEVLEGQDAAPLLDRLPRWRKGNVSVANL